MSHFLRVQYRNRQVPDPDVAQAEEGLVPEAAIPLVWARAEDVKPLQALMELEANDVKRCLAKDNEHPSRTVFYFEVILGKQGEAQLAARRG